MKPFDPATFPLEADLSRADVRVLYEHCRDRHVVEFGCGGSTVILALIAAQVQSYDTDPSWVERTQRRLDREENHACRGVFLCGDGPPDDLPVADVYFVDGHPPHRMAWIAAVLSRRLAGIVIAHDSRSEIVTSILPALVHPNSLALRSVEFHVNDSNMVVIRTGEPVVRVNWNETEPENRLPFLG